MGNISVSKPPAPKYQINSTVYVIVSATKGFIEPLFISNVEYDPSVNTYLYTMKDGLSVNARILPTRLYEHQITDICTALTLQIQNLQKDYDAAVALFTKSCPTGVPVYTQQVVYEDFKMRVQPPRPRFGFNEVVYLIETAQSVGRLEATRISDVVWNNESYQWNYVSTIYPTPDHHMTVGDANNRRQVYRVAYAEPELATFCEAQDAVVKFLLEALTKAQQRLASLCSTTTGS